ncbi:hypothetical protein HPP92_025078 [Vanilla planifolia]|uniref:Uncharacterized protein n=1 Tax=Vanilla planifolia TaxID=51239 RepID=A0A835PIF5_VANPL|nr:hypothetical protein HPP92_025078 [Vanilla planifolia]
MLATLVMGDDSHIEIEEDEEEDDVDFNPVLRGETPSEASSSLSSENEGPCDGSDHNNLSPLDGKHDIPSPNLNGMPRSCDRESVNEDSETVTQFDDDAFRRSEVLNSSIQESSILTCTEGSSSVNRINAADNLTKENTVEEDSCGINNMEPIVDDDDAIWRRTRARHSLVNYTLEELETFLQESDDDGVLQNVDDEEEYRKFLAAVLLEEDVQQPGQGDHNCDEDEDNDADFEIELEEALESDVDEATCCSTEQSKRQDREACVPETRQKKRLKESAKRKKFIVGQAKATLRPILPCISNSKRPPFPSFGWQLSSPAPFPHSSAYISGADLINGFTACQIGQLYCLIHEHVQILLQVFSVCALDPSKQHVAKDTQKLISEMVERHEMALAHLKISYPQLCFEPSNLRSSVQVDSNQTASRYWTPVVDNPVQSILDVAPLRLAKGYMADIAETVLRHRQSYLETGSVKSHLTKEPLFALPVSASLSNTMTTVSPASCQPQPKKSLAATLVESTMKQSAALVPADISKSAQRFFHLFNPALFPHKPPVPAVANRVLFTDAEDGLLAMGLMEHNNDWSAIQQHFLPCKSKHQ